VSARGLRKEEREALEAVRALGEAMLAANAWIEAQPSRDGAALRPDYQPFRAAIEVARGLLAREALRVVKADRRRSPTASEAGSDTGTTGARAARGRWGANIIAGRR
jgi:hypothetical protein